MMFTSCRELVNIKLKDAKYDVSFAQSPLLSLESLQYLINKAVNISVITVTVHVNVYTKIRDESNVDWYALLALAQEKQITFATA